MKNFIVILLAMALLFAMVGCSAQTEIPETTTQEAVTAPSTMAKKPAEEVLPEETAAPAKEATLTIDYADNIDGETYFDEGGDNEYAVICAVRTDTDITNVKFVHFTPDIDDEGNLSTKDAKAVFTLEKLPTGTVFYIRTVFEGDIPTRSIEYSDAAGHEHCLLLSMSGEDGSLILSPIA